MKCIFKANALTGSALLRCDCFLFYSLFHLKFHIIMKTSSTPIKDRRLRRMNQTKRMKLRVCDHLHPCTNRIVFSQFHLKMRKNNFYKNKYESTERTANVSTCDL